MDRRYFLQATAAGLTAGALAAQPARATGDLPLWCASLGHGFGIQIHDFSEATLDMVAAAGFTLIRTDFFWSAIEPARGRYDWTLYDALVLGLKQRNLRPVFVLGFNNPDAYSGVWMDGITVPAEIAAFAAVAAAAVQRYADLDPLWEVYNEPNRANFWAPTPDPAQYMALAEATIAAIRATNPAAIVLAPALGHRVGTPVLEVEFLESCLQSGLLPLIDAVSIHPYVLPEVAEDSYNRVTALVNQYATEDRVVPLLATEWGFAVNDEMSEDTQADMLVRMFLVNRSLGIPVTLAYVAVDATADYVPEEERHYGIVRSDYSPKPAFVALQTMMAHLNGKTFTKRLPSRADDFLLEFTDGLTNIVAAWTWSEAAARDVAVGATRVALTGRPVFVVV